MKMDRDNDADGDADDVMPYYHTNKKVTPNSYLITVSASGIPTEQL